MISPVVSVSVAVCVWSVAGIYAQYSSSGSSGYGSSSSAPASSNSYAASPAMQSSSSSSNYPAVNLPLLSYPALLGNASVGTGSSSSSITSSSSTSTGTGSGINYLSSLPSSPITNLSPYSYVYGTYPGDYDASRDSYYNKSNLYVFNEYTSSLTGYGPLNLSNPVAVAAANWWSPYPYALAAWNDGYTTQGPSSTTAASTSLIQGTIINASTYYAAYGGNVAGLGVAGLGLSVPGPAPNVSIITPGLNYAYNVGSSASPSPSSYSSYSSPTPSASSGSSYGGSSGYGR